MHSLTAPKDRAAYPPTRFPAFPLLLWRSSRLCDLIGTHPPRVELSGRGKHRVDHLVYIRGAALEADRVDSCDHERTQMGAVESTFLQLLHRSGDSGIQLQDPFRPLPPPL